MYRVFKGLWLATAIFALLCLVRPVLSWLAANTVVLRAVFASQLLAIPLGFLLARLLSRRLSQKAGFTGGILVPVAALAIAATVAVGSWAAVHFAAVAPLPTALIAFSAVIIAYSVAAYDLLMD